MAWGGWSSLAALQRCSGAAVHAPGDRRSVQLRSSPGRPIKYLPAAFLGPGLLLSAWFGADHGGRRALKMVAAIGRGSSNLVNAAGS